NSKYKIYSHINASCPTCVSDILLWDNIISDFEKFKVPVILICESDDNFDLFEYIIETGEIKSFSFPFFLDLKSDFYVQNKFMKESSQFETVLTDSNNIILLLDISVMLTPVSVILTPLHRKWFKEQKV
ncbi:MAG TPA: hypothetical protein VE912_16945, partial [Bacteroidales bacterium]|nr:hypothetical protein [Bacteroidales bacterium]